MILPRHEMCKKLATDRLQIPWRCARRSIKTLVLIFELARASFPKIHIVNELAYAKPPRGRLLCLVTTHKGIDISVELADRRRRLLHIEDGREWVTDWTVSLVCDCNPRRNLYSRILASARRE